MPSVVRREQLCGSHQAGHTGAIATPTEETRKCRKTVQKNPSKLTREAAEQRRAARFAWVNSGVHVMSPSFTDLSSTKKMSLCFFPVAHDAEWSEMTDGRLT